MSQTPLIVTLTGPSGTGKSYLAKSLVDQGFTEIVSTTTRPPRAGEVEGVHYYFVDEATFLHKKEQGMFVETICLGEPGKQSHYGVLAEEIIKAASSGKPVVVVAEPHGVAQIHDYAQHQGWHVERVFLNNDPHRLVTRILNRFHEDTQGLSQDDPLYLKRQQQHAQRLIRVLQEEQEQWVGPALRGEQTYELIFDSFGPNEQAKVVEDIMERIQPFLPRTAKKPSP